MGRSPLPHMSLPFHLNPQITELLLRRLIQGKTFFLSLVLLAAFLLLPGIYNFGWGQTTLAAWNFPNNPDNATADGGIAANTAKLISLINADDGNNPDFSRTGNTTNCASSLYWQNGSGVKCFVFSDIVTTGYSSVTFSASMRGNNLNTPRDFKIQYRYNNGTWTDVGLAISLSNTFTYSTIAANLSLPSADNQADIDIRIIQTSNTSINNGAIGTGGSAWVEIDDVEIKGDLNTVGDPAIFGNGVWNVYGYNGGNINLTGIYCGYYTEGNLSYNTTSRWNANGSPSDATGWQGSLIPNDNHIVVSKRTNFTCGYYQLDMPSHDDDVRVYINGILVFSHEPGCCDSHTNIWTGYLTPTSTIEVRHLEGGGGSYQSLTFIPIGTSTSTTPTSISGITAVCSGGSTTLTQIGGVLANGADYKWYTGSCGGTLVGSGPSITVSPVANTTYYVRAEGTCNTTTCISTTVTITPAVGTPVFSLGSSSSRYQGAGTVLYSSTATNSTGITYSLDATSTAAGNSISTTTGSVTYVSTWQGTSTITASAAGCGGPKIATHTVNTSLGATYYSYQTGNWNLPSTWTFDPSGTTQVGTSVPGNNDIVIILSGRTVSLPANISSTGLDISIEEGSFLDLSTFQFTAGLKKLSGQGTLVISSGVFPTPITTNTFVNVGGGTTEYRTATNLPSQNTYNNLTINSSGIIVQTIDLTLNGNLKVKKGTYQINDNTTRKLKLTVNGDATVDNGAFMTVGTGVTNSTTNPLGLTGGTAPFLNYYDAQSHRIVLNGNFTNNGTVRFTNLAYPVFNAFPPTSGATAGFATVYFQGASDNTLLCAGTTDFYNLVLNKGIDQTFKLTIYTSGSSYANFRLFGANVAGGDGGGTNPNLKKALWIRTGTLVLEGLTMIPSMTEGNASEGGASPNSDFYIPANGALVLNGTDVAVLSTADDYREVNLAYNTSAPSNAAMGITAGGTGCALSLYGKLQVNDGYLSTRESGGIITSNVAAGQFILNKGTVDSKQFLGSTGAASYEQNGGLLILRGRFQRTFTFGSVSNLLDASVTTLNTVRLASGINSAFGSFNLENTTNIFAMSGGTIRIYDVCDATTQEAFDVKSSSSNSNVTGGTLEIVPTSGTVIADAVNYLINSTATLGNLTIDRASSTSGVQLNTNALNLLNNFTLTSGVFNSNNLNVTIGGNFTVEAGTTYTPGTNTTVLNGAGTQIFTVNIAAAVVLNKFTIDKTAGSIVNFAGSQKTINVNDNFRLSLGTLNDNGNTLNVYKDVYNSGIISGTGKVAFIGTVAQSIDGNGIFQNIELNNNNAVAAPVSLVANTTINGTLTFSQNKLFDISTYNLKLNGAATIAGGNGLRYIKTSGNSGDGGVTKVYASTTAFVFPIGAPSTQHTTAPVYTPVTLGFSTAPATYGSVTVIPVGYEHPSTTLNGQSLTYFWRVKSAGFVDIAANSVTHSFVYDQSDVVGTESNYIPSVYNRTAYTWNNGVVANISTATNTITDWAAIKTFLDGDYTAGDAAFGATTKFYSISNGNWRVNTTWSNTSGGVAVPAGVVAGLNYPGANSIVIIENNNTVSFGTPANYLTAANTEINSCASLQIEAGATLNVRFNPSSNFGMVLSHLNGNGTFRVTTDQDSPSTYVFPFGDFSDFNVNMGTTELYTTNPNAGTEYYLPENVSSYGNLILSPIGGSNVMFPNKDLLIYGNLTTKGQNADSWFCPSWGGTYPGGITTVAKTINIKGNLDIQGGALIWYNNGATAQNFIIGGNVTVAALSAIFVYSGATNQSMSIGGSLINNADGLTHGTTTNDKCDFTNIPVTFFGSNDASITNSAGNPTTTFSKVTINKGISQATTLTFNIGGTLTTPVDNWLTLQNGTFKYMRNVNTDFAVSTNTPFTIPATAAFHSEYTTANNILIANSASNTNDVYLNGKLKVVSGNVYIGPINGTSANNNDIEYSGGGASEIEINGGTLVVNGQIRQNSSSTAGVLKYKQSGGIVTINGNSANTTNAKLEILNSGSEFTMSAGTLTIVRGGGGNTYGDLYLRPGTGSVTGGDLIFAHNLSGSNQQYLLDAILPLNNLTVSGRTAGTAATATVKLMVNPLVLNGNLTLSNVQSILDVNSVYNLPVTIKGNFTNSGTYNHYNNLTTFSGGTQSLLGTMPTTPTDFYDLNVSPITKLTLIKDITVTHDLSMNNGTLECATFTVNVKGNVANNATFTNTNTNSGLILNGSSLQRLSGSGTFGQMELNNAAGAVADNNVTFNKDLVLTAGILDINAFLLTLGQNSNIQGAPFSAAKMITSDGVWSNIGIEKVFGSPLTTTFTYPLGTPGKYTPAILTITNNGHVGSIRVNNINSSHPAVLDPANVLKYYWEVESTGISGFTGNLLLYYNSSDVVGGPENAYIAAQLLTPGTNWSKAATGSATDNVNETNHTIRFNFSGSSNLTGEFTAGNDAAFPNLVPQYTSNKNGNWSDNTIWTPSGGTIYPCPAGGPNGFIVTIDHEVTADANYCFAYKTNINGKLKAVASSYGHNFGTVYGNGTLYLENSVFPAGRFASFLDCAGSGTLEYGGTGTYDINASLYSSLPKMLISGTGTRIMPDKDLIICQQLKIDDGLLGALTLDNSINNRKLTINGTFERYNNGIFNSGTGPTAFVKFAGSAPQTIGGNLGDFSGINAFNNFEINNSSGLSINNNGGIEVNGDLLLTNGLISTTSTNKFTITNYSVSCVFPNGGSAVSYIDGPLIKKLNQGDPLFKFPVGKKGYGLGNKLSLRATQTGTLYWVVEYFSPDPYLTYLAPITSVNTKEYWNVSGVPATSKSYIDLAWDNTSDLTPLMTQNGVSDMRVAEHNGTDWVEIASDVIGGSDNYNGSVETKTRTGITSGSRNYTLSFVNTPKPRIRLTPGGPVCGSAGIPVVLTTSYPIFGPYSISYTKDGIAQTPLTPASFPTSMPTATAGGVYKITGFTYNYPAGILQNGVFDITTVTVYAVPTASAAGPDQSLCGATTATLAGNSPTIGTGLWTIISGTGGTVVSPTSRTSVFNGTNGTTYTLRWTITNGTCTSLDDVVISFPLLAAQPLNFTASSATVCQGNSGVVYTVPNDPSVSYNWGYSGVGATITGTTNSVTISFSTTATSGNLSVTATNSCNTSVARSIAITVNPLPTVNVGGAVTAICQGGTTLSLGGSFGGGATSAVWSDGGAGGTFANNGGSTPNTTTYTASAALVTPVTLTLTTSGGSCGTTSANKQVTVNPSVGIPVFTLGATSTRCQGAGAVTYTATAINNTGLIYTLDAASVTGGNTIVAGTGAVTYVAGWSGTTTVTISAIGCNGPKTATHAVTITPTVGTPSFTLGATSTRCQGAGAVTYTATASNNTGLTYTLDAASVTGGNTIAAGTGAVTYAAGWSGTTTVTVSATGCNGPKTATHTVTITPTVGTPAFTLGATSIRCQGTGAVPYTATATNNTGLTYSLDAASLTGGNTIVAGTGVVTYAVGWSGTTTVTVSAAGCNGPKTTNHTVTITPTVGTPVFTLGATSTRCQGAGVVTYTATASNSTGLTYTLDAASVTGGNAIVAGTGAVTFVAGWSGSSIITSSAAGCNGPKTANHTVTITPTVSTPIFTLGPTTSRCRGAGTVAYTATATNTTGITYTLDAASTTGGNSIVAATGVVTYAAGWSGSSVITASAAGCNGPKTTIHTATTNDDQVWTGAVSTNWNISGNWSCGYIPELTTNVRIPNVANKPILGSGVTGTVKDIGIEIGSSLTVTANTLQIAGTITNSGTFTATSGSIEMKGTIIAQTIGAGIFSTNTIQNLTITNPAGVTLSGPLNVTGVVTAHGNLSSGGNLTLVSTATQTALILGTGTGNITGNVTMQRYLPSGFGYKYFSSPFQATTVGAFSTYLNLAATFPTFYKYDESKVSAGWVNYTNSAGVLSPMVGYAANFGALNPPKTVSITGTVNNNILTTLPLFNNNKVYTKGFNLVGNPYPSPIDWKSASGWTKTNIDDAIYLFNAGTTDQYTGVYSSYVNNISSDGGITNNIIASMQGFFIHVSNGTFPVTAALGATNSVRINNLNPSFKSAIIDDRTILRFAASFDTKNAIEDAAVIYFDEQANRRFEKELDALKMLNTDLLVPNIYTLSPDPEQLSINGMPFPADSITKIPLGITTLSDGWINFKAKDIKTLSAELHLYLIDAESNIVTDLKQRPDYRFYLKKGEYLKRFTLVFSLSGLEQPAEIAEKMFTITRSGDRLFAKVNLPFNTKGDLLVTNMQGKTLLQKSVFEMETVDIDPNVGSGIYIVTMISGKRRASEKILIRKDYE